MNHPTETSNERSGFQYERYMSLPQSMPQPRGCGANLGNGTDSLVAEDASVVYLGAVTLLVGTVVHVCLHGDSFIEALMRVQ